MNEKNILPFQVYLEGNPIFSLTYKSLKEKYNKKDGIKTDITSYRPDPRNYLKKNKKYDAQLIFYRVYDTDNNMYDELKYVIIGGIKFYKK